MTAHNGADAAPVATTKFSTTRCKSSRGTCSRAASNEVVWYDLQHPLGDGIGFARLLLPPGIDVASLEDGADPIQIGAVSTPQHGTPE